jgi:predicted 3-demethylubiquinone-9 3-methyltransferase (glyoxalase superfamily)
MPTITPHLWYDKEAGEAARLYTSAFPHSRITGGVTLHDTPSGDAPVVSFELWGYPFQAISAGPLFKLNPSISFMVNFDPSRDKDAQTLLDAAWSKLVEGGQILMPLDAYPFSPHFGWVQDKYGLTWQLILTNSAGEERPPIIPSLLFVGAVCGKAEAASDFYISLFPDSKRGTISRYPGGMAPEQEGSIMFTDFMLAGKWFTAMDSAHAHNFAFNEAVSFMVSCDTQEEIDYYWEKLSAVPEAEQCGWLKDKYGVSWQIVPAAMGEMMSSGTPEQLDRVTQAFLPMKKFDIAKLQAAYAGK